MSQAEELFEKLRKAREDYLNAVGIHADLEEKTEKALNAKLDSDRNYRSVLKEIEESIRS